MTTFGEPLYPQIRNQTYLIHLLCFIFIDKEFESLQNNFIKVTQLLLLATSEPRTGDT